MARKRHAEEQIIHYFYLSHLLFSHPFPHTRHSYRLRSDEYVYDFAVDLPTSDY